MGAMERVLGCLALAGRLALGLLVGVAPAVAGPAGRSPDKGHRLESFRLFAPSLGRAKRLLVYLPPGYDDSGRRYPVFYLNDGHDLLDWNPFAAGLEPAVAADIAARDAWYGSWRLESQLDRAIAHGRLPPLIVVGVAADDGHRSGDLVPVPWSGSFEGRGVDYGRFVAHTLVPAVEARYRAISDRRCRGIGGASLGGVSALQIGLAHADRFGLVLALSPVLSEPAIAAYLAAAWAATAPTLPSSFLVDLDDDAAGTMGQAWLGAVAARVQGPRRTILAQTPGGRHHIASWASRAIPALMRLLGPPCGG